MQFAPNIENWQVTHMSNRELVIDLISKLPEDTPLVEIARKIELIAGIQIAREEARCGLGISEQEARALIEKWAAE